MTINSTTNNKKVALVTGANRGLGLETARQLEKNGITVVVAARSLAAANQTAERLQAEGLDVFPAKLDVTSAADPAPRPLKPSPKSTESQTYSSTMPGSARTTESLLAKPSRPPTKNYTRCSTQTCFRWLR